MKKTQIAKDTQVVIREDDLIAIIQNDVAIHLSKEEALKMIEFLTMEEGK